MESFNGIRSNENENTFWEGDFELTALHIVHTACMNAIISRAIMHPATIHSFVCEVLDESVTPSSETIVWSAEN